MEVLASGRGAKGSLRRSATWRATLVASGQWSEGLWRSLWRSVGLLLGLAVQKLRWRVSCEEPGSGNGEMEVAFRRQGRSEARSLAAASSSLPCCFVSTAWEVPSQGLKDPGLLESWSPFPPQDGWVP